MTIDRTREDRGLVSTTLARPAEPPEPVQKSDAVQPAAAKADGFEKPAIAPVVLAPAGTQAPAAGIGGVVQSVAAAVAAAARGQHGVAPAPARPAKAPPPAPNQDDPSDPMKGMTPEEQTAYLALSPQERAQFDELHRMALGGNSPGKKAPGLFGFGAAIGAAIRRMFSHVSVQNLRDLVKSGQFGDYMAISAALAKNGTPKEQEELRSLIFGGRAKDVDKRFGTNASLLQALAPLAKGGVTAQGVDRTRLLRQLITDLSRPETMVQGTGNSDCGGVAAAFILSRDNPAEYARAVTQLAETGSLELSPEKKLHLPFGGSITLMQAQRLTMDRFDPKDHRSITQQIFAHTFVEFSAGPGMPAGPMPEGVAGVIRMSLAALAKQLGQGGLVAAELQRGISAVTGQPYQSLYVAQGDEGTAAERAQTRAEAAQVIAEHAAKAKPLMVNVGGTHWAVVTGISGQGDDAQVQMMDGSGGVQTMSMKDLLNKLDSMVFNSSVSSPPFLGKPEWGHRGGGGSAGAGSNGGND